MKNVDRLREYKATYGLTNEKVAQLLDVSIRTVKSWLARQGSTNNRPMSDGRLNHLKLRCRDRKRK